MLDSLLTVWRVGWQNVIHNLPSLEGKMSHSQVAPNTIAFSDGRDNLLSAIYPSSVQSGAATIGELGRDSIVLTLDDVVVLRDQLSLCIEQAAQSSPFAVVNPPRVDLDAWEPGADVDSDALVDGELRAYREGWGHHG